MEQNTIEILLKVKSEPHLYRKMSRKSYIGKLKLLNAENQGGDAAIHGWLTLVTGLAVVAADKGCALSAF